MSISATTSQLDPSKPLVWESPTTLRVGFERAIARVAAPSAAEQRVIALLLRGATEAELASCDPLATAGVLAALQPALVAAAPTELAAARERRASPPRPLRRAPLNPAPPALRHAGPVQASGASRSLRVLVNDDGRELPHLRAALEAERLCTFERDEAPPDLAIEVLRYIEPLGRTSRWLSADLPALLIRFTDDAARVGPIVRPDGRPCHGCETLHLTDDDPAIPAIAAQLYGTAPSAETATVALSVGVIAAHLVSSWRRGETWVHDRQIALRVAGGRPAALPTSTRITPHEACGCAIRAEPPPPQRSATAA